MGSFAKYVGGSPTNSAIGLARLGLKSAVITRVGADHMGRFVAEQLEREGVDTSAVRSDPDRLTALVILGIRDRLRIVAVARTLGDLPYAGELLAGQASAVAEADAGPLGGRQGLERCIEIENGRLELVLGHAFFAIARASSS